MNTIERLKRTLFQELPPIRSVVKKNDSYGGWLDPLAETQTIKLKYERELVKSRQEAYERELWRPKFVKLEYITRDRICEHCGGPEFRLKDKVLICSYCRSPGTKRSSTVAPGQVLTAEAYRLGYFSGV